MVYFPLQETAPERVPRVPNQNTLSPRGSWLSAALMCTTLSNRAKSSSLYCSRKCLVIHRNYTAHLIHTSPHHLPSYPDCRLNRFLQPSQLTSCRASPLMLQTQRSLGFSPQQCFSRKDPSSVFLRVPLASLVLVGGRRAFSLSMLPRTDVERTALSLLLWSAWQAVIHSPPACTHVETLCTLARLYERSYNSTFQNIVVRNEQECMMTFFFK